MTLNVLQSILGSFKNKRVLVIGDVMIDHYLWGKVERISPEAPVPVVDVYKEEYRLGGAANVALNLKSLGAVPLLVGITGNDRNHSKICSILKQYEIDNEHLIIDNERPTTLKSRVIAHSQHIIRIDNELKDDVCKSKEEEIIAIFRSLVNTIDCIILEDYNKGMLTPFVIKTIIDEANEKGITIAVDPKFKYFFEYKNCTLFKPNIIELEKNSGIPIENEYDMDKAANKVLDEINAGSLIVTRGEKGLTIYRKDKARIDIPTFAREIYDVSGAGDTVISVVALCLCCGLEIEEAAVIANHAAGAVCGKIGIQPVNPQDIIQSFTAYNTK